jgi:hypothetical protein
MIPRAVFTTTISSFDSDGLGELRQELLQTLVDLPVPGLVARRW